MRRGFAPVGEEPRALVAGWDSHPQEKRRLFTVHTPIIPWHSEHVRNASFEVRRTWLEELSTARQAVVRSARAWNEVLGAENQTKRDRGVRNCARPLLAPILR